MNTLIAIAHRDRLLRESLVLALSQQDGMVVGWEASGLDKIPMGGVKQWPDVILVDFNLPLQTCLEQIKCFRAIVPGCKTIMLGVPDTDEAVLDCIEVGGASGYVLGNGSFNDVVGNIRAVMAGESVCSPRMANLLFSRISALRRHANPSRVNKSQPLTRREEEIVESIERGLSNKEIATRLHIEVSTVKNHVHNILDKLKLQDRRSAVRYVKEHGLTAHFR